MIAGLYDLEETIGKIPLLQIFFKLMAGDFAQLTGNKLIILNIVCVRIYNYRYGIQYTGILKGTVS
jgi:hypothetical protein